MKYNGLNVFDITLTENDIGIGATSLVTIPAMESQFIYFDKDKPQFIFSNEEKREIVGAFMIPDKLIYRNIDGNKFYVNFTKEVIKELTSRMIKTGTAGLFTVQHKYDVEDGGIDIQEIWIKESDNDKSMDFDINEPIGTAFMKVKVNDERIWKHVKESGLNGFSIELDASIVEKNELLFKQDEPKITKMNIKDVFANEIEVGGVNLHFNSELGTGAYLVTESEEGKPVAYTGAFSYDGVAYKVEKGIVLEAENVELSTRQAIENLLTEFSTVRTTVEGILTRTSEIEEREAELELLKTQLQAEKQAFQLMKEKGIPKVNTNLSVNIPENGLASKAWLAKF